MSREGKEPRESQEKPGDRELGPGQLENCDLEWDSQDNALATPGSPGRTTSTSSSELEDKKCNMQDEMLGGSSKEGALQMESEAEELGKGVEADETEKKSNGLKSTRISYKRVSSASYMYSTCTCMLACKCIHLATLPKDEIQIAE